MFTEPYIGNITIFAGTFAPRSYQFCAGQLLSIAEYTALFSLLGTTFGGDGVENFALPDFRGRVAVHQGQGPGIVNYYTLGDQGGTENIIMNTVNLPVHTHPLVSLVGGMPASADAGTLGTPVGNVPATTTGINSYNSAGTSAMKPTTLTLSTAVAGGSQPLNNASPVLAMNYIIAVEGIYPSRN